MSQMRQIPVAIPLELDEKIAQYQEEERARRGVFPSTAAVVREALFLFLKPRKRKDRS